jgi:hypothetical protein
MSEVGQSRRFGDVRATSGLSPKGDIHHEVRHVRLVLPAQPVDATQALNLSAGVSNCKVSRGRSLS